VIALSPISGIPIKFLHVLAHAARHHSSPSHSDPQTRALASLIHAHIASHTAQTGAITVTVAEGEFRTIQDSDRVAPDPIVGGIDPQQTHHIVHRFATRLREIGRSRGCEELLSYMGYLRDVMSRAESPEGGMRTNPVEVELGVGARVLRVRVYHAERVITEDEEDIDAEDVNNPQGEEHKDYWCKMWLAGTQPGVVEVEDYRMGLGGLTEIPRRATDEQYFYGAPPDGEEDPGYGGSSGAGGGGASGQAYDYGASYLDGQSMEQVSY
jgi:hypothetical protein